MDRRRFLQLGVSTAAAASLRAQTVAGPVFETANAQWQRTYDHALAVLAGNVRTLPRFAGPVLIEGAEYPGIWQECAPQEGLAYRRFRPDAARNNHLTFFALQREDGQLPANNKLKETGFGQIQMVVPIAATAWELAHATGDTELLDKAYLACSRWDAWLLRYRNTRGTGLTEGFCTYDTGMDNSGRWAGMPNQCPGKDAKVCPAAPTLPRLCPDLSATTYGGRVALAAMARALGKTAEADRWTESAETMRGLILARLRDGNGFYDLGADGKFVKADCVILSRLCGEHVLDQTTFDAVWTHFLGNPQRFWTAYPLPSTAVDDPLYVAHSQRNSWGGPAQALTALRAGRWFDHYGRSAEFTRMMNAWCEALVRDGTFRQQMDPATGVFSPGSQPGYSPAALVFYDYTWRVAGVEELPSGLRFNLRPGHAAAQGSRFRLRTDTGRTAEVRYTGASATVSVNAKTVATLDGGHAALICSAEGVPERLLGVDPVPQRVRLKRPGRPAARYTVSPNQTVPLPS